MSVPRESKNKTYVQRQNSIFVSHYYYSRAIKLNSILFNTVRVIQDNGKYNIRFDKNSISWKIKSAVRLENQRISLLEKVPRMWDGRIFKVSPNFD